MRPLVAALALLASAPALAQSQYADGRGAYVALETFDIGAGRLQKADATVGVRLAGGADAGLRVGYTAVGAGEGRSFSGGPTAGISRPLGKGFVGRVEGALRYVSIDGVSAGVEPVPGAGASFQSKTMTEDITATVSRPVRVVGSVRIRPAIGVYATAIQTLDADQRFEGVGGIGAPAGRAGLHLHVPVSFRVFGADAVWAPAVFRLALVPNARLEGVNDTFYDRLAGTDAFAGSGFRLNL